ncbi:hypothetical protein PQQ63_36800 [Paraburkholderia metrosideri]|uniref:Uncharacterized protein n=1 Tax=Paraburkholderia metrosideri TaxID=580937 RepID=A0ABW9E5N7_9BURK
MTVKEIAAVAILALSLQARADVQLAPASDIDLHAAYCVGTETQTVASEGAEVAATNRDSPRRLESAAKARLLRLHHYLDGRLTFVAKMDIDAAIKRGSADMTSIVNDPNVKACANKCWHLPMIDSVDVAKRCMAPCDERLPQIWSCKDLSWLP